MRPGRSIVALAVVLTVVLAPAHAAATDSDLKHAFAFKLDASDGYSIVAVAMNERADGRGEIVLFVSRGNAYAIYAASAMLTATSVRADLGSLGEVSLDVTPSGKKKRLRSRCGDEPETFTFEPQSYRGIFEFHGEEGYTEVVADAPLEYNRFFLDLFCAGVGGGETGGADLPGARLRLTSHRGSDRLSLQANKNRPGARSRFEVEIHEKRRGVLISRGTTLWAGAAAFDYDPMLRTATLEPPAPFSGRATFHRGAAPARRWRGSLTVDLPGHPDVPLTGTGARATLVPSCWQGEGAGSPADCGF